MALLPLVMKTLNLWQRRLFYLILFLIPTNLAKHWPLSYSYVSGHLVDYLIPTLYLTDILIIILLSLSLINSIYGNRQMSNQLPARWYLSPSVIFLTLTLPSVIFATHFIPAIYHYCHLILLSLLAHWLKNHFNALKHLNNIIFTLSLSALFQSFLSLTQWFKQTSVFGYWFLGEQPYTDASVNIDKITWFNGAVKIPPLGTLPHSNILAAFLIAIIPLMLYQLIKQRSFTTKLFYTVSLTLSVSAVFLTFSLSAWLSLLLIGLPLIIILIQTTPNPSPQRIQQLSLIKNLPRFQHWQQTLNQPLKTPATNNLLLSKFLLMVCGLALIALTVFSRLPLLIPESSFTRRSQLTRIALSMLPRHWLLGIGLNNFTAVMDQFGLVYSTTRFLQPVHNIYLLFLSETGLLGLTALLYWLLAPLYQQLKNRQLSLLTISYLSLLFIGLFDHHPLTLQTSLLLFILNGLIYPPTSAPIPQSPTAANQSLMFD